MKFKSDDQKKKSIKHNSMAVQMQKHLQCLITLSSMQGDIKPTVLKIHGKIKVKR